MTNEEAIKHLQTYSTTMGSGQTTDEQHKEAKRMAIEALSNSQNQTDSEIKTTTGAVSESDVIYRRDAIDAIDEIDWYHQNSNKDMVSGANPDEHQAWYKAEDVYKALDSIPSAQPEPLTDKEQRIFLAAIGRKMKVCEEVDKNYTREPYEDSLVRVCREIERKVKKALWMI